MSTTKNKRIINLGLLKDTVSQLKVGDEVCAYDGNDGEGNPCIRIVEHINMQSYHWIMNGNDLESL